MEADGHDDSSTPNSDIADSIGAFLTTVKRGNNPANPSYGKRGDPVTKIKKFSWTKIYTKQKKADY